MNLTTESFIKLVIHHNHYPVKICRAKQFGFMGLFLKDTYLGYPVGTALDVEFPEEVDVYTEGRRIPMVINKTEANGTGLRLKNFKQDDVLRWQDVLQTFITSEGMKIKGVVN